MESLFCPLAADWEVAGQWAGVVVAAIGAGAVTWLGHKANQLGRAANEVADKPRQLAEEADRREAEVLLVYVSGDILGALTRLRQLTSSMRQPDYRESYAMKEEIREEVAHQIMNLPMGNIGASLPRLHVLPMRLSHALARSMGQQRTLTHRAVANRQNLPPGRSHTQEFDFFRDWLNVIDADLEIVANASDYITRHGIEEYLAAFGPSSD